MPMETRHDLEHTTERLTEGLRCPWKWGHCSFVEPMCRSDLPGRLWRVSWSSRLSACRCRVGCFLTSRPRPGTACRRPPRPLGPEASSYAVSPVSLTDFRSGHLAHFSAFISIFIMHVLFCIFIVIFSPLPSCMFYYVMSFCIMELTRIRQ